MHALPPDSTGGSPSDPTSLPHALPVHSTFQSVHAAPGYTVTMPLQCPVKSGHSFSGVRSDELQNKAMSQHLNSYHNT